MGFFQRLSNGWSMAMTSFSIILENGSLLVFPLVSGLTLLLVLGTFYGGVAAVFGSNFEAIERSASVVEYGLLFAFYVISYGVIIFFNMALIHCAILILNGKEASLGEGVGFAFGRLGQVISWALVAATVGMILRIIEDKHEGIASLIAGIFGMLWSVLTFFVIPVMAYENLGVFSAIKRSGALLKETWGERVGADFTFGTIGFLMFLVVALPLGFLFGMASPAVGVIVAVVVALLIACVTSASQTVFIAASYQYATGKPTGAFAQETFGGAFSKR